MGEETSKRINFFKDIVKSIKDLDKYEDYALESPKSAFKYLFKLILIFCILICIFYTYLIVQNMNEIFENFKNTLPDFLYAEGILTVDSEEPIIIEDYKDTIGKIIIDVNASVEEYEKQKFNGILLLKDKCIILSDSGIKQEIYNYKELAANYEITKFTKNDIIDFIQNSSVLYLYISVYFMIFVYLIIIYFMTMLMDVLLLSILAYFVSRISRIRLKFGPSFCIATHAITLSVVLNLIYIIVNLFTGFEIKYFQMMYNTISYIYVIVAILMIKTDFIQRQMELIKLAEEQEKVREEIKQEEESKKEQKEKQEEENQEDKKNEKTSKRKNNTDDEDTTGANAPACSQLEKEAKEQG